MGKDGTVNYLADLVDTGNVSSYRYALKLIAEINYGTDGKPFLLRVLSDEEKREIVQSPDADVHQFYDYDFKLYCIDYLSGNDYEQLTKIYNSFGPEPRHHYVVFTLGSTYLGSNYCKWCVYFPDRGPRTQYKDIICPAAEYMSKFKHCYPVLKMEDLFLSYRETGKNSVRLRVSPEYADLFLEIPFFRNVFIKPDPGDEEAAGFLPGPYSLLPMIDPVSGNLIFFELQRVTEDRLEVKSCVPRKEFLFSDEEGITHVPVSVLFPKKGNNENFLLTGIRLEDENLEEELSEGKRIFTEWSENDRLPPLKIENLPDSEDDGSQILRYNVDRDKLWTNAEEFRKYLIGRIQTFRPSYTKDVIVNIAICITQGFLTIFSGVPGCGKTSICDMFADALGLTDLISDCAEPKSMKDFAKRYISVSVEQGWTSKRDFIGYYNSLFHEMSQSNHEVYEKFEQLDAEKKNNAEIYPCLILLDEANLSPMEYYWSDFMKIGDEFFDFTKDHGFDDQSRFTAKIGRGDEEDFHFSETLRFLATMNNDYSTSPISPRLTDRAWVITLPEPDAGEMPSMVIKSDAPDTKDNGKIVTWEMLRAAFDFKTAREIDDSWNDDSNIEVRNIYKVVVDAAAKLHISVSPRTARVIKRYCAVASDIFDDEPEKGIKEESPAIASLDYAVAQKILPYIDGDGPEYRNGLENLSSACKKLLKSSALIQKIIEDGEQMNFYKFFH